MKTYLSILLLFCAVGLSYGSSHVVSSDSVIKNRTDTIQIVSNKIYIYRGEKLSNKNLDSLLKSIDNKQVEEYVSQSKSKNKTANLLIWLCVFAGIAATVLVFSFWVSVFDSIFKNKPSNADSIVPFIIVSDVAFTTSGIFGILSKRKSRRLKRKAVERYNEIVKSGK